MTAPRAVVHLPEPPPADELRDAFPATVYPAGAPLFRSHGHRRGPWWFADSGQGRFDFTAPDGTCYVAEDEVITLLETYGGLSVVPAYETAKRDASELRLTEDVRVADLTSNLAAGFRVTSEIATTTDYPLTQRWAAALRAAGYEGVRYWARHDLVHEHACVALFDRSGDQGAVGRARYDVTSTVHLPRRRDLLDRLTAETGIAVLGPP
ncbi:RES domain-containing protein [Blastococcus sp. TF02-8]|uniref:RES family NAD+ phosphorylase n=1 Tax=Blastococcus sp. TF02-8 TaxID=2250574 RepID=UPI000DEB13FC|nr:RES family NAD+ phosphorylase [Blastococcus sp. TF02-8]RBY96346.1 RES domain-containing protein [Blastococcus sp. TF02-8]